MIANRVNLKSIEKINKEIKRAPHPGFFKGFLAVCKPTPTMIRNCRNGDSCPTRPGKWHSGMIDARGYLLAPYKFGHKEEAKEGEDCCPVCLDGGKNRIVLRCRHKVCDGCCLRIMKNLKMSCPLCRAETQLGTDGSHFETSDGVVIYPDELGLDIWRNREKKTQRYSAGRYNR